MKGGGATWHPGRLGHRLKVNDALHGYCMATACVLYIADCILRGGYCILHVTYCSK